MTRVLVAARSAVVRAGLESVVRASVLLELAGVVDWQHLEAPPATQAEVLLAQPGDANPEVLALLIQTGLPLVLLLDAADDPAVSAALRAGARGILSAESAAEEIESALRAVAAGLVVVSPESLPVLAAITRPALEEITEPLSERELEVLNLIAEGLSNKLVAHRLEISEHTVKTHVTAILSKLGAGSRTEAVSQAIRRGLVML